MSATMMPARMHERPENEAAGLQNDLILRAAKLNVSYGGTPVLKDVSLAIPNAMVTAFIGPSGCGKSTLLRCFNRMNDLIDGFGFTGQILFHNANIYAPQVDPVLLRRHIGMVFQKPHPFPMSIFDNVAFGARVNNYRGNLADLVEQSLRRAALWDEVKDRLQSSALSLSGGQQQRLCIARALAVEPSVLLMDEPCSALDPISTQQIEDLICSLRGQYTVIIVTHNMQQAFRVSDKTAFFNVDKVNGTRCGTLVEFDQTKLIFSSAKYQQTRDYISGRFG